MKKEIKLRRYKDSRYFPLIYASIKDIYKYNIKNYENKYEVSKKIVKKLKETYLSTEVLVKPIININTGMRIEIWKKGIKETFEKDEYYKNFPIELKKAKIATMFSLAKLIKYGKVRAKEASNYHNLKSKVKYAYLVGQIDIDGVIYNVTIDIRKSPKGENRFYIHNLKIKNKDDLSLSLSDSLMDKSSSKNSIAFCLKNVNTN